MQSRCTVTCENSAPIMTMYGGRRYDHNIFNDHAVHDQSLLGLPGRRVRFGSLISPIRLVEHIRSSISASVSSTLQSWISAYERRHPPIHGESVPRRIRAPRAGGRLRGNFRPLHRIESFKSCSYAQNSIPRRSSPTFHLAERSNEDALSEGPRRSRASIGERPHGASYPR